MLLRFYKLNQPAVVFTLPLFALFFWVRALIPVHTPLVENTSSFYQRLLPFSIDPIWGAFAAFVFIVAQAVLVNTIFNRNEFLSKNSFLPSLFYVVWMSATLGQLAFNEALLSNFALLFFLRRLLQIQNQQKIYAEVFDAGLLIGIAAIVYLPYAVFFCCIWTALLVWRPFGLREWIIPLVGMALPYLFFAVSSQVFGVSSSSFPAIAVNYKITNLTQTFVFYDNRWLNIVVCSLVLILAFMSLYQMMKSFRRSTIKRRNVKRVFLGFLGFSVLAFLFSTLDSSVTFQPSILAMGCSILYTFYFYFTRNTWLNNVLFYTWTGAVGLYFYYLSFTSA